MGADFTSRSYPFVTAFVGNQGEESHEEPASEDIKTSVKDYEHPFFSATGPIGAINAMRGFSNSIESQLSGEIANTTITDMVSAALKNQFPVDMLMFAADLKEALPDRDGMGDAQEIIDKIKGYVNGFSPPKNYELFMAYAVDGVEAAKQLIEKAKSAPLEKAVPIGSKYDDIIFYKLKNGEKILRNNKEVVQFFYKRMMNGQDFFPHLPLGTNVNANR